MDPKILLVFFNISHWTLSSSFVRSLINTCDISVRSHGMIKKVCENFPSPSIAPLLNLMIDSKSASLLLKLVLPFKISTQLTCFIKFTMPCAFLDKHALEKDKNY